MRILQLSFSEVATYTTKENCRQEINRVRQHITSKLIDAGFDLEDFMCIDTDYYNYVRTFIQTEHDETGKWYEENKVKVDLSLLAVVSAP